MIRARGFTIVELLIVIVVIGILAALTIVAFNGVQNRARISQASSALAQAKKKLELYKADLGSGLYPTTGNLSLAGVADSDTTYQYTSDGTTFCLTATASTVSYKITEGTVPTAGGCAGHGQGGVAAVTNLATNPSLETNATGWSPNWGTSGAGTNSRQTDGGRYGTGYYRMSWTANATVSWGGAFTSGVPVVAGRTYAASVYVRVNRAHTMFIFMRPNTWSTNPDMNGSIVSVPANTWTRLTGTYTIVSGVTSIGPRIERTGAGNWQTGDTLDVDGLIISELSSPPNYGDGDTTDWVWNGTAHASTSTGPAQ